MRDVTLKPITIFSVTHTYTDNTETSRCNTEIKEFMQKLDIDYKLLHGVYTYTNGTKSQETSYLVCSKDFDAHLKVMVLGDKYSQESVLRLDNERSALLDFGEYKEKLGKFVNATESEAKKQKAYTLDPETRLFWIVR